MAVIINVTRKFGHGDLTGGSGSMPVNAQPIKGGYLPGQTQVLDETEDGGAESLPYDFDCIVNIQHDDGEAGPVYLWLGADPELGPTQHELLPAGTDQDRWLRQGETILVADALPEPD